MGAQTSSGYSAGSRWRELSYWFDTLPEPVVARPALAADIDVDVAIVGAGYTGLWTAYYLARADPGLRVAVVEREVAGYGASGRNGGWCSAFFAISDAVLAREVGLGGMHAMRRAMQESVDEVGAVAASENIDCHYRKGGSISLARSSTQVRAGLAEVEQARSLGLREDDICWYTGAEACALVGATSVLGGVYTPHCASLHPARLARGLAAAVERRGVTIYEQSPVTRISRAGPSGAVNRLETPGGRVRAEIVVQATEGYSAELPGKRREVVPLYSLMVATEPLPTKALESIRLRGGLTFTDGRHLIIYGQLTVDGRLAFGGRGAPYHFASGIETSFELVPKVHDGLRATLVELFPEIERVEITHRWGGPLGVHRDWYPSVNYDRAGGRASAGAYAGDGVSTTNLAGRTLADLIAGRDTPETHLCWVGHRSPAWEPEPLRWIGVNTGLAAMRLADRSESRSGRPSRLAAVVDRLTGH
ncbi:MAG: FAD-binding oxidoreductase [Actinomycetota bacterium]|jgi:glycine/D-amino acid oxidase-like deaminating enzyme|nr:FAD-binding oxidoreductase [Actinomycetota bacterium]